MAAPVGTADRVMIHPAVMAEVVMTPPVVATADQVMMVVVATADRVMIHPAVMAEVVMTPPVMAEVVMTPPVVATADQVMMVVVATADQVTMAAPVETQAVMMRQPAMMILQLSRQTMATEVEEMVAAVTMATEWR